VEGPRGKLTKNFRHLQLDITVSRKSVSVEVWWGNRKHVASVRTVATHIKNMILGVTEGFQYNMRLVYAHFPIITKIDKDTTLELTNFLGTKINKAVRMSEGVKITRSETVKDQIEIKGNDLEKVSQSAASIFHAARVKGKDIRKFLDGIYVSEKGLIKDFKN
jgi:large subunit ribosomal protein L9e